MQLQKKIILQGCVKLETGLHIGGSNTSMSIGGVDKTVIRNPLDNRPIIPGSSLKGKMRSLLELAEGTIGDKKMGQVKHGPTENHEALSAKLFGTARGDEHQRPSRVIVRDCSLIGSEDELAAKFSNTDLPFTEAKAEVVLDRITAKAMPRQNERVPAGAEFTLDIVVNVFDRDELTEKELVGSVMRCLMLVQDDYIGGNGSRGYGKVKFYIKQLVERNADYYIKGDKEVISSIPIAEELK